MKKQKVLLINPHMCDPSSVRLPLSVLALGAMLEGQYDYQIIDGNVDAEATQTVLTALTESRCDLVALTVMPGPQVGPAITLASAVRVAQPHVPIAWGGYFPTLYPDAALNAPYVDYVVRGQGEDTLLELLAQLPDAGTPRAVGVANLVSSAQDTTALADIQGLSWKNQGQIVHNSERHFRPPDVYPVLPYERLGNVAAYLRPSFLGSRTAVHQAAIGCRYRCGFCGVVSMFNGYTQLPAAERLEEALTTLRGYGANAMQFYDHNFFDREDTSIPFLEVLTRAQMPWWCYARADTLANFSAQTWELLRRSQLKMAYIGAEAASDEVLKRMHKGARVDHTFEVAYRCREYSIIPEFSFVLGGPHDPEAAIEQTFTFVKQLKAIHPLCEIILYFYSPTPQRAPAALRADTSGASLPVLPTYGPDGPELPTTPEEWTQRQWLNYVCHQDAPWLSPTMRQRIKDFAKIVSCRFPTVQDHTTPAWGKFALRSLASWRYATGWYGKSWELDIARRLIPLREPQRESL